MICYNITIKVVPEIESAWVKWQMEEHIPEVMATKLFDDFRFFKLLEQDEADGITYIVQFFASSVDNYKNYIKEFAPTLREKSFALWRNQFIAFRTVMETVR